MIQRTISILGSTGSIGTQTLDVAESCGIRVAALTTNHNIDLLEQQARIFKPVLVAAADMTAAAPQPLGPPPRLAPVWGS